MIEAIQRIYKGEQPVVKVYNGNVCVEDKNTEFVNINEVPYIATYYIQPIIDINDEVDINYYVTDYYQREYKEDNVEGRFKIEYWIDNTKYVINNVQPGDNSIHLERLPLGSRLLAFQATDTSGRKSHRLFQEIKVIDQGKYEIELKQWTYAVTDEDLKNFKIQKDNTLPIETTTGLNELIKWCVQKQYKKAILPKGIYRIDENGGVMLENLNQFTLDLNGSTLKLNPNALEKAMIIALQDCNESHVINGTLEGDLNEHDFVNAPGDSEGVHAMIIRGGSYNSFEDLVIKDVTGYGSNTMFGKETMVGTAEGFNFKLGDIVEGEWVETTERYSSEKFVPLLKYRENTTIPIELYNYVRKGYFQLGAYLGYQGNVTDNWVYKATFYDENKNYIEAIEGYAYRRMYLPKGAKFVRITLFSSSVPSAKINLFAIPMPVNCVFKNLYHQNIRAVGMAINSFINLLVEGCTFEKCGYTLAKCAVDAEDGWDLMQDLTFRKNIFKDNPYNNFLACAGHNFIIEENQVIGIYLWERVRSYVVRNNQITLQTNYRYETIKRSGYIRVCNNNNLIAPSLTLSNEKEMLVLKQEKYKNCVPYVRSNYLPQDSRGIKVVESSFENNNASDCIGSPRYIQLIRCTFKNFGTYLSDQSIYKKCSFINAMNLKLHGSMRKIFIDCEFINCWMKAQGAMDALFDGCIFKDMTFYLDGYDNKTHKIEVKNCKVEMTTKEFINLRTSTPIIVTNTEVINNNPSKYYVINCSKNGLTSAELTLKDNVITQSSGNIITGVVINSGAYLFKVENNTVIGEATLVDGKYKDNKYIVINTLE